MYKITESRWMKHLDFTIIDVLSLEIALIIAFIIRFGHPYLFADSHYQLLAALLPVFHIAIVFFSEEYSGILQRGYLQEFKAVLKHNGILGALIFSYFFTTQQSEAYSRFMVFTMLGIGCLLVYIGRLGIKRYLFQSYTQEKNVSQLLIVTTNDLLVQTIEQYRKTKYSRYMISGSVVIDNDLEDSRVLGVPVVANQSNLLEYVRTHTVDGVLINIPDGSYKVEELADKLLKMGITVHINVNMVSGDMPNKIVEELSSFTVVTSSIKFATTRQLFLKRVIDICGGIAGLFATTIAFVIFAPIIYYQSPGPIFFSQERVGRNGRRFRLYKFRSMYMDAEERKKELMAQNKMNGLMFKMDNDPRIMPIGKFLRKVSIDELPQSLNILKGDMSLVGTRPPTVDEYEQYQMHHKRRLAARPGLTGMWQISGRSDITDFEEVVALDTDYISNFTLGLYLKILFKTIGVVLNKKGSG